MGQTYSQPTVLSQDIAFITQYAEAPAAPPAAGKPAADATKGDAPVPQAEGDENLVIPADLSTVPDADLAGLHSGAVSAFTALYEEREMGLTDEQLEALSVLTDGIERVQKELDARKGKQNERASAAAALAARAGLEAPAAEKSEQELAAETAAAEEAKPSGPAEIRLNLGALARRASAAGAKTGQTEAAPEPSNMPTSMKEIVLSNGQFAGAVDGTGLDWDMIGKGLDRRLSTFQVSQYEAAAESGRHVRQQMGMLVIKKPFEDGLVLSSTDPREAEKVMSFAADEKRLSGNSLVASGGWCAPSQTIYDLLEIESRDGIYDLPTIGVTRGGINHTTGPSFSELFAAIKGFSYTEAQDQAGTYAVDANGVGTGAAGNKPCYHITCPPFTEDRLGFDGLCLTAGLLEQRGYPEVIARTTRGALVVHDHLMAGRILAKVIAGSTAVSMAANQVGATAPILDAIEKQVEHYRYTHRLQRSTSLEAVFPFWVHGVIRADLSRRLGVDLLDVSDARINGWFTDRGVAPQFVYNFDDLTGTADTFTAWPTTLRFLLYAAGTWVRGSSDIITLDTLYDSQLLGTNDYTALFTEEGWLVAKRGFDSRIVSVSITPDGATHGGVSIDANGAQSATAQV